MGISICSKADPSKRIHMGYMSFGNIRMDIANAYNYEIGIIHESHYKTFKQDGKNELCKRFDSIFDIADRKTKTLMRFLCKKDTGASASSSMCKIILELKEKIFEMNKSNKNYTEMYLKPFFEVVKDGCKKGIEWA